MVPRPPSNLSFEDIFRIAMYMIAFGSGILAGVSYHNPQNIAPCFISLFTLGFAQWGVSKSGRAAQFLLGFLYIVSLALTAGILALI